MSAGHLSLQELVDLLAAALKQIDATGVAYKSSKPPYRQYQAGVGPYSETQLAKLIVQPLQQHGGARCAGAGTRREPDLLIPLQWAIEFKIARPFGDNGKEAEHWSQNLLHPYPGNVSSLADAHKLRAYQGPERRAVVVIGYEHSPPIIDLDPLILSFELIAREVLNLQFGHRGHTLVDGLIHPVHQRVRLWAWEVLDRCVPALA